MVSQTNIGTVLKATLGKVQSDGAQRIIMGFPESTDAVLN